MMKPFKTLHPFKLGVIRKAIASWSPTRLFSDPLTKGVWYDPSDFSTMFQDAAGTVPVTAVGQPVGLMLDKSKGLVLSPELVTNGEFSDGTTGWTANVTNSAISVSAGALTLTRTSIGKATAYTAITTVIGKSYEFGGSVTGTTGSIGLLYFSASTSASDPLQNCTFSTVSVAVQRKPFVFTAKATTTYIHLVIDNNGPGGTATIDNISVRELPGNHAFNPSGNSANFPVLQQDGTGRYYLAFNGVNQWLQTNSIDFTYGDKMFVSAGVRKLSDAANSANSLCGLVTDSIGGNSGHFEILTSDFYASRYFDFISRGTVASIAGTTSNSFASPKTLITSGIGNISGDRATLRLNGSQVAESTEDQGTGNYGNYPMYIGARAGSSFWFNGRLYGLVVAGKQASASEIASTEAWLNQKTGAY